MKYNNIMEALESGNKVRIKRFEEKLWIKKENDYYIGYNGYKYKSLDVFIGYFNLSVNDLFEEWYDYEEQSIELKLKKYLSIEFPNYADYFKTSMADKICKEIIEILKPQD